jgi:DNA (cytosine-5)-methyltransferase 1
MGVAFDWRWEIHTRSQKDLAKSAKDLLKSTHAQGVGVVMGVEKKARAIDLYSGIGGWSLGLRLSGIEVVASYEYWGPANETNFKNNAHLAQTVDIRRLALADLPSDIDIVVGSPPCTQFSFSNRGGGGDIADGLKDIKKFLSIVDHLKPRVWAMENVPRVAKIIETEMQDGGALEDFRHLGCSTHIVDMAEFGVPQRRRRCIAGNFNMQLLNSYRSGARTPSLGDVVQALAANPITDPLFGIELLRTNLTDHVKEDAPTK